MIEKAIGFPGKPRERPRDPRFSSGPCKKYPGWEIAHLNTDYLGRSHRAKNLHPTNISMFNGNYAMDMEYKTPASQRKATNQPIDSRRPINRLSISNG